MIFGDKFKQIENWGKKKNLDKLKKVIADRDPKVRIAAAQALGIANTDDSLNVLISSINDPEPSVKIKIIETIGNIGAKRSVEHLRHLFNTEKDPSVIQAVEHAMKNIANSGNKG